MVILMEKNTPEVNVERVIERLDKLGFDVHRSTGIEHILLGVIGDTTTLDIRTMQLMEGVADAYRITAPYKLVSREFKPDNTVFRIGEVEFGGEETVVMAGPCSIESEDQIMRIAEKVAAAGAKYCVAAPLSRVPRPMPFRGWGKRA